jgi:hypothetical protein
MAYTTKKTWNVGDVLTASDMNTYVGDNIEFLHDRQVFLTTPLTSTAWDGDSFSTTAKTKIDLSDVFGAPAGIKAVLVHVATRDSASAESSSTKIVLAPNDTADLGFAFRSAGMPNDVNAAGSSIVPCDANGDIYYQITASGTNTTDVWITIWGYWL